MKDWIIARLREKSTWLGLVSLLGAAGLAISPELSASIVTAGLAIGGLVATVKKEK